MANVEIIITATDKASGVLRGISKEAGGLGGILGGALKVGLAGATVGIGALGIGLAASIKDAMAAEGALARLDAVLKATKGAAGITSAEALKLATALQRVTRFSDETVISAQSVLLQFRSISKEAFPKATETALNLATALGTDASNAARLLGKALETPGEGLLRLKAAGVAFTDTQEKQIQAMVKAGNVAGAQKLILDELEKSTGGAARAAGTTFAGQLDILGNQLSDVMEEIGGAFLPILRDLVTGINENVLPALKAWAEENAPKIKAAMADAAKFIEENWPKVETIIKEVWSEIEPALAAFQKWLESDGIKAIQTFFAEMEKFKPLVAEWKELWKALAKSSGAAMDDINTEAGIQLPSLVDIVEWVMSSIREKFEGTLNIIRGVFRAFGFLLTGDWRQFGTNLQSITEGFLKIFLSTFGIKLEDVKKLMRDLVESINNYFSGLPRMMANIAVDMINGLVRGIEENAWRVIQTLTNTVGRAIDTVRRLLGIASPSRVFAEMGAQMAAGLAQGFGQPQLGFAVAGISAGGLSVPPLGAAGLRGGSASVIGNGGLTFVYAPMMSLGDENEVRGKLVPVLDAWYREARSRRV